MTKQPGFGDIQSAAKMRDLVRQIVTNELNKQRPASRVGKVQSINTDDLTAEVSFAGDKGSIRARFGLSLVPRDTNAIVRVDGAPGNYYITEIINQAGANVAYEPVKVAYDAGELGGSGAVSDGEEPTGAPAVTTDSGLGFFVAEWSPVANADPVAYRVYVAAGAGVVPGPASLYADTPATSVVVTALPDGTPFTDNASYSVKVVAYDADGEGPASAEAIGIPEGLIIPQDFIDEEMLKQTVTDAINAPIAADRIVDGAVGTLELALNAVTNPKIADNAVASLEMADNAVIQAKIADAAVATAELVDNAANSNKIVNDAIIQAKLADNAVGTLEVAGTAITTAKLALLAATSAVIGDAAVLNAKINDLAVNSAKVADAAIGSLKVADAAIVTAKIGDAAVSTLKVVDSAITNAKVGNLAVNNAKIDALAVDNAKIAGLAVDAAKIANLGVTNAKIDALAVDAAKIASLAVQQAKIADLAVNDAKIGSLAVITAKIADLAVQNAKIEALAVNDAKIANLGVTNAKIADLAVSNAKIADLAVNNAKIANLAVTNAKINDLAAEKIDTGFLAAARIAAGSMTVDKLSVGALNENLVVNPNFQDNAIGWILGSMGGQTAYVEASASYPGGKSMVIPSLSPNYANVGSNLFPVVEGATMYAGGMFAAIGAGAATAKVLVRLVWYNSSGGYLSYTDVTNPTVGLNSSTARKQIGGRVTVPVNARFSRLEIYNYAASASQSYLLANDLRVVRAITGDLLVDGVLTGREVVGAYLRTKPVGQFPRIEIGPGAAGDVQLWGDAAEVKPSYVNTIALPGLYTIMQMGPGSMRTGGTARYCDILMYGENPAGSIETGIQLRASNVDVIGSLLRIGLSQSGNRLEILNDQMTSFITGSSLGDFKIKGDYITFDVTGGQARIVSSSNYRFKIRTAGDTGTGIVFMDNRVVAVQATMNAANPSGSNTAGFHAMDLHAWNGGVFDELYVGGGSTTASVNNSGRIIRTGSLKSLKKNISDLTLEEASIVRKMVASKFQWRNFTDMGAQYQAGFVADQGAEVGAELWLSRDSDNALTGVRYAEITAAHNVLINDLYSQIETLKEEVNALKAA